MVLMFLVIITYVDDDVFGDIVLDDALPFLPWCCCWCYLIFILLLYSILLMPLLIYSSSIDCTILFEWCHMIYSVILIWYMYWYLCVYYVYIILYDMYSMMILLGIIVLTFIMMMTLMPYSCSFIDSVDDIDVFVDDGIFIRWLNIFWWLLILMCDIWYDILVLMMWCHSWKHYIDDVYVLYMSTIWYSGITDDTVFWYYW